MEDIFHALWDLPSTPNTHLARPTLRGMNRSLSTMCQGYDGGTKSMIYEGTRGVMEGFLEERFVEMAL